MFRRNDLPVRTTRFKLQSFIWLALVVILAGVGLFLYQKVEEKEKIINDPAKNMELERKVVLDRLNKFIELPSDEEPTIVTILDAEKLRNQPLFLKAENGDKLIVYDKARKVLLYRYTTNKIIEFDSIDMMPAVGQ